MVESFLNKRKSMPPSDEFETTLAIASWILYGVGIASIITRLAARRLHFGTFRKFQIDDYLMLFTAIPFTVVIVASNQISKNGSNYSRLRGGVPDIPPDQVDDVVWGSKMAFLVEEMLIILITLLKACILLMYHRFTLGLWQHTAIKVVAVYTAIGFVVTEILLFAVWCRPFHLYWAIPIPSNRQCATYYHHMVVASVFNLSSDIAILIIPLPILITSIMPLRRKFLLGFTFSLGIFVILAAVLNRYYNFTQKYSLIYLNWYVAEATIAVLVTNIPLMWPLFRRLFALNPWGSSDNSGSTDSTSVGQPNSLPKKSSIAAGTTPGTTRINSTMSTALGRNETHDPIRIERSGGLNDILGNLSARPRGQSSLGIEDIDIDVELGKIEAAASPQHRRSVIIPIRPIGSIAPEEAGFARLERSRTDIDQHSSNALSYK